MNLTNNNMISAHGFEVNDCTSNIAQVKHDGWWAVLLLVSLFLGPEIVISAALPPFRAADIMILFLFPMRFFRAQYLYGGFFLHHRSRLFILFMFTLVFLLVSSTMVNYFTGRYPFYYKDVFIPLVFLRMTVIAAIAASFYWGPRQQQQFFRGLVAVSVVLIVFAFAQKLKVDVITSVLDRFYLASERQVETMQREVEFSRVTGTFGNPNVFGGILVMLSAFFLAGTIHLRGAGKLVSLALYATLGLAVLTTTGSRTALLGFALVFAVGILLSMRKGSRFIAFLFMLMFFMAVLFLLPVVVETLPVNPRVKEFLGGERGFFAVESLRARFWIWEDAWSVAKDSPFIGVGATKTMDQLTDNGYLQTILRTGLIGLVIYLVMLIRLSVRGLRAWSITWEPWQKTLVLGTLLILVNHALFETTGDFFWHIRYGAVFGAFVGILCGFSSQLMSESQYVQGHYPLEMNDCQQNLEESAS